MNAQEIMQMFGASSVSGVKDKAVDMSEYFIDSEGNKHSLKGRKSEIQRMEGKTGTKRRSRKGRTTTLANGSRAYLDKTWYGDEPTMVAYVVKPS
jgi:hypothetical protein